MRGEEEGESWVARASRSARGVFSQRLVEPCSQPRLRELHKSARTHTHPFCLAHTHSPLLITSHTTHIPLLVRDDLLCLDSPVEASACGLSWKHPE